MYYLVQRNNQIKLTHYDDTKKMAHDSQKVRAKENLKLSYGGPANDNRQAPTDGLKPYVRSVIKSEPWPTHSGHYASELWST